MSKKKLLQNELYELTVGRIEKAILLFHQLEIPISDIPSMLLDCVTVKVQNAELYLSFYSSILPTNNEKLNNLLNYIIIQNIISTKLSSEKIFFLFLLFDNGILSISHIIQIYTSVSEVYLPLFLIFLPEFSQGQFQGESLKKIASTFNIDIEQNVNDQWKQFKAYRSLGQNPDPILTEIRNKKPQKIENLNDQVPFSIFERATILKEATYSEYLVYFNHPDSGKIDFNEYDHLLFEKVIVASIYGNNFSFFSKYSQIILGYEDIIDQSKNKKFIEMEENHSNWTIVETYSKSFDLNWKIQILTEQNYHILNPSEINGLIYSNKDCCLKSLNNWAYRQGFKLVKNQSTKAKVLQLRCYLGKRHKSGEIENSNENQDCNFKVSISERKDFTCKIRIQEQNNKHNHQLNPSLTFHFLLPIEIIETIKILRKGTTATHPGIISKYVQLMTGIVLKANQIDELSNLKNDENINNEAQELIDYLWSTEGKVEIIRENGQIIVILTFTKNELINIEKYGDVLSIEKIEFKNKFEWKSYLIYGINFNFELISFGTFFLLNNDVSKFKTAFEIFLSFVSLRRKCETLVTGIDKEINEPLNLLLNTSREFDRIKHVINSNDIICEFKKNLYLVNEEKRNDVIQMIEKVAFSESESICHQNLLMLFDVSEKISQFLKKNFPDVSFYARSIIGSIKTYGLNYISLKKNLNNLISTTFLDNYVSLIDCKKILMLDSNTPFQKYVMIEKVHFFDQINTTNDIKQLPTGLGENVITYILNTIQKVSFLEGKFDNTKSIIEINDINSKEKFLVSIKKKLDDSKSFNISCSCQSSSHIGLPCCHLFKAYQIIKKNEDLTNDFNQIPLCPWCDISSHFFKENKINQNFASVLFGFQMNSNLNNENDDVHYKRFNEMMSEAKEAAKLCVFTDEDKNDFISLIHNFANEKINKLGKSAPNNNSQINDLNV